MAFVGKPLRSVTLGDVQEFADSLNSLLPAALSSSISLFTVEACEKRLGRECTVELDRRGILTNL
jgi:hypothetical protein